ncbi:MAG: hypothetical protein HOO96_14650 [Polyangiaceae bacterium]|nr:hypothetical protein [Polyangiaceae bacterium]
MRRSGTLAFLALLIGAASCSHTVDVGSNVGADASAAEAGGTASDAEAGAPGEAGTAVTQAACARACEKVASCGFLEARNRAACESECVKRAYPFQLDCVNAIACADLERVCGGSFGSGSDGGTSPSVDACQTGCDQLHFFSCIDASTLAACRTKCTTATATRDTFSACTRTAGGDCARGTACLGTL